MIRAFRIVLWLAVAGLLLTGCPSKTEQTIGAVLALSGSGAAYGDDIRKGMDLAAEEVNTAGGAGGLPIRILYEDSGSDPGRALAAAERLIEQKVPAIVGGVLSSETLAMAPRAEESEVVLLSPASSSPKISTAGNYVFRVYPSDVVEGTMMAEYMLNQLSKSRIMVIAVQNEYGQGLKEVFAKRYRSVPNREILEVINFAQGESDWSDEVASIRANNPDGIYLVGYPTEMLSFLQALRAADLEMPVLASRSFDVEMLKVPAAEGVIFPRDPFDPESTEQAGTFAAAYQSRYGSEPTIWAANGYDAVKLLAEAIASVGDRASKIQNWLTQVRDWRGASGILTFDRQGDVEKMPVVSIVHGGDFVSMNDYEETSGQP